MVNRVVTAVPANDRRSEEALVLQLLRDMADTQAEALRAIRALSDELQEAPTEWSIPFRPFFRIGDLVRVIRSSGVDDVVIRYVSALPGFRYDFGVDGVADATDQEVTELEMGTNVMAQLRFSPLEPFEVELDNPAGVEQWRSSTQRWRIGPWLVDTSLRDADRQTQELMSQFWVWEDDTPRFNLRPLANHYVSGYVQFWGWRYDIVKVSTLSGPEGQRVRESFERGDFRVFRLNGRP